MRYDSGDDDYHDICCFLKEEKNHGQQTTNFEKFLTKMLDWMTKVAFHDEDEGTNVSPFPDP